MSKEPIQLLSIRIEFPTKTLLHCVTMNTNTNYVIVSLIIRCYIVP